MIENLKTIKLTIDGEKAEIEAGVKLLDIAKDYQAKHKYPIILAKVGNEYHVYLKDIILDYNSDDYIIVTINNNDINIDYTNLMKILNNSIKLCTVNIKIEEKNEIGG